MVISGAWIVFISSCVVIESHIHDNYFESLINKFSSDGSLSQLQFQELAIDLTANKLPGNYSSDCDHQSPGTSCNRNQSIQVFIYFF